jgi:hypothetical protein
VLIFVGCGFFLVLSVRLRMDGLPFGAVRPGMAASTDSNKKKSATYKSYRTW